MKGIGYDNSFLAVRAFSPFHIGNAAVVFIHGIITVGVAGALSGRIEQIRALLTKDPEDVFLHYSLGKELASAGRTDEALQAFAECTRRDGAYLPAHVESAKRLRAAGRLDEARAAFETALAVAQAHGEQHAADNIRQHLESL
jgi:tetratricopeptide (TPR) repeat protein